MKWLVTALSVGGLLLGTGSAATAASITFTGTNGSNLSASATFDTSGTNLVVTLTNTSLVDLDSAAATAASITFTGTK